MLHVGRLGESALFVYLKEWAEEQEVSAQCAGRRSRLGGLVRSFLWTA
jgi:hypothetical protein